MPEVSYVMDPVQLQPFSHQVGGSTGVMSFNETTLCKPLNPREHYFYLNMPPDLKEFTPEYRGKRSDCYTFLVDVDFKFQ